MGLGAFTGLQLVEGRAGLGAPGWGGAVGSGPETGLGTLFSSWKWCDFSFISLGLGSFVCKTG